MREHVKLPDGRRWADVDQAERKATGLTIYLDPETRETKRILGAAPRDAIVLRDEIPLSRTL